MSRSGLRSLEGIITSDAVYHGHLSRRLLLGVAGMITVLGIVAGIYIGAHRLSLFTTSKLQPVQAVENLNPTQKLSAAQEAVNNANTPQAKAQAYEQLGGAYIANNQLQSAVDAYQSASSADESEDIPIYGELIGACLHAGDKQEAIDTIQKLIPLLQASSSAEDRSLAPRYQNLILEIQARP